MLLIEKEISVLPPPKNISLLAYFKQAINDILSDDETPIRFVITQSDSDKYHCELGLITDMKNTPSMQHKSIFDFEKRQIENTEQFNTVFLVPTGIGAEIGGHAGDATPVARLLSSISTTLITHPNVVNASDINELPENGLYVEGSVISQLLMGTIGLQKVRSNRVMLVIGKHKDNEINEDIINAVSAARATLGLNCPFVVEMEDPIHMHAEYSSSGRAVGRIEGFERLCKVVSKNRSKIDALALSSIINIPDNADIEYFHSQGDIINPWGGVEAMLTHAISILFDIPSAHSPIVRSTEISNMHFGIVDPRMSAETISVCYLHCILKGLHRSPQIVKDTELFCHPEVLSSSDISCLVIPDCCVGLPTLAALEQGIPIIAVRENRNCMRNDLKKLQFQTDKLFIVDNYFEAVGIMSALKTGVTPSSVRRPLGNTNVMVDKSSDC